MADQGSVLVEGRRRRGPTYHEVVTYQPADRYWPLQWCELGISLAVALLLAAACAWRLRKIG